MSAYTINTNCVLFYVVVRVISVGLCDQKCDQRPYYNYGRCAKSIWCYDMVGNMQNDHKQCKRLAHFCKYAKNIVFVYLCAKCMWCMWSASLSLSRFLRQSHFLSIYSSLLLFLSLCHSFSFSLCFVMLRRQSVSTCSANLSGNILYMNMRYVLCVIHNVCTVLVG